MRFFLVSFLFFALGCSPNSNTLLNGTANPPAVDQTSYKNLIDTKWCETNPQRQDFLITWIFVRNPVDQKLIVTWEKSDASTKQILSMEKMNWSLENKTLKVNESKQGLLVLKKEISFTYDLEHRRKLMTWTNAATLEAIPTDTTNLSECE